jgi:hypothetical protein
MQIHTPAFRRSLLVFLALVALAAGLSGCTKKRASMAQTKASKLVAEARERDAEKHVPDLLKQADEKIASARQKFDGGDFATALIESKAACDSAKALLDQTEQMQARARKAEADKDIQAANENQETGSEQFTKANEANAKAQTYLDKGKFTKCTDACNVVRDNINVVLSARREAAEKKLAEVTEFEKMLVEKLLGPEKAPSETTLFEAKFKEYSGMVTERKYVASEPVYEEVKKLAAEAEAVALRKLATEEIQNLTVKLQRAETVEAKIYHPNVQTECQADFDAMVKNTEAKEFRQAIAQAEVLHRKLDSLILESRRSGAQDRVTKLDTRINKLQTEKVEQYVPNRLEPILGAQTKAREEFATDRFDECKSSADQGLQTADALILDFKREVEREQLDAETKLGQADTFLKKMAAIFEQQTSDAADPLDKAFEQKKVSRRVELEEIAKNAEVQLAKAKTFSADEAFSSAIETSRLVSNRAGRVVHDVYQVVAHNTLLELGKAVSDTEADGAAEFAPVELENTKKTMADARQMMRDQDAKETQAAPDAPVAPDAFQPAMSKISEARTDLETVFYQMKESISGKITEARSAIGEAEGNQANVHAMGAVTTSRQVLQESESLLANGKHYAAARKAEEARRLALEASVKAIRTWAEQEMAGAKTELRKAVEAQADQHNAPRYQEALSQMAAAEDFFATAAKASDLAAASQAFGRAREKAAEARKQAEEVRMGRLTESRETITTAKRFGAWEHDYPVLVQSITLAKRSFEAMQAGEYAKSNMLADESVRLARQATVQSQRTEHAQQLGKVDQQVKQALAEGPVYYRRDELIALVTRLRDVRDKYTPEKHEDISVQISELENELFRLAQSTPEVFNQSLTKEKARFEELDKRGGREFADKQMEKAGFLLRHADLDFRNKAYESSYRNLKGAEQLLTYVEERYASHDFAVSALDLMKDFETALREVDLLTSIPREQFKRLHELDDTNRMGGAVLTGVDLPEFRRQMEAVLKKSKTLECPPAMAETYARFTAMIAMADRSSSNFEKFTIINHFSAKEGQMIVDNAFNQIEEAKRMRDVVADELEKKGLLEHLARARRLMGK